jgi:hypothetical protein
VHTYRLRELDGTVIDRKYNGDRLKHFMKSRRGFWANAEDWSHPNDAQLSSDGDQETTPDDNIPSDQTVSDVGEDPRNAESQAVGTTLRPKRPDRDRIFNPQHHYGEERRMVVELPILSDQTRKEYTAVPVDEE